MALFSGGVGIWDGNGKLQYFFDATGDMEWGPALDELLTVENCFLLRGQCGKKLVKWDATTYKRRKEVTIEVPTGGLTYLIVNHQCDECLITWLDQHEWGYVRVSLPSMTQLVGSTFFGVPETTIPQYSPDDGYIVSCSHFIPQWWAPQDTSMDSCLHASPGGIWQCGEISVHDLAKDNLTQHKLYVKLPKGWIPDEFRRAEEVETTTRWDRIWGPEFVSPRRFKIWLPDHSTKILTIPLPDEIVIKRGLKRYRIP